MTALVSPARGHASAGGGFEVDNVVDRPMGRARVRVGRRPRPARDPRPWRRTRAQANITGAARADVAEMEMPPYMGAVTDDPSERFALPEEFPDGPYDRAPGVAPHGAAPRAVPRRIPPESDPYGFTLEAHDRDDGAPNASLADDAPERATPEEAHVSPPASGDEPSD